MKTKTLIPDKAEMKAMVQGLKREQQPDKIFFLRGLIYHGAKAKGMTELEATRLAVAPEIPAIAKKFKINVSFV